MKSSHLRKSLLLPLGLLVALVHTSCRADPNTDPNLDLLKASSSGDVAAVKKLIAKKADVNYQHGTDKITALMISAMRGRKDVFELLLNSDAHPNVTDKDGATARNYLALVSRDFPKEQLKAMVGMIDSKGGTTKNFDALAVFLFVGGKPLSPNCYDFKKAPCGVRVSGGAPAAKPSPPMPPRPTAKVSSGPDLNGSWKLNLAKSKYGSLPAPDSRTEVITHSNAEIIFDGIQEVKDQTGKIRMRYLLDRRTSTNDVQGIAVRSTAKWDGSVLVVRSEAMIVNQGSLEKEDRFTLSSDGKTLTQVQTILSGKGGTTTMVFDRQ